jgi:hypothetical protein
MFNTLLKADPGAMHDRVVSSISKEVKEILGRPTLTVQDLQSLPVLGDNCKDWGCYLSVSHKDIDSSARDLPLSNAVEPDFGTMVIDGKTTATGVYAGRVSRRTQVCLDERGNTNDVFGSAFAMARLLRSAEADITTLLGDKTSLLGSSSSLDCLLANLTARYWRSSSKRLSRPT